MQAPEMEEAKNKTTSFGSLDVMKEGNSRSKIFTHFIKVKIALWPMETILSILGELEYLANLVKLAQKKKGWQFEVNKYDKIKWGTYNLQNMH